MNGLIAVLILLMITFFGLVQLQVMGAEKRVKALESVDFSHIHDAAPFEHGHNHTHVYSTGEVRE